MRKVWYKVAELEDIPVGAGIPIILGERNYCAVFRSESDAVYASTSLCPHQNEPLDQGHIEGNEVICRRHHLRFDLKTGNCTNAGGYSLQKYDCRVEFGEVFVAVWEDE